MRGKGRKKEYDKRGKGRERGWKKHLSPQDAWLGKADKGRH